MTVSNTLSLVWTQTTFKPRPLPEHVNLVGQAAIITGSNVGLGLEAAKELALHNISLLILAVRDVSRGETAKGAILEIRKVTKTNIEVWPLDQDSYESMTAFGERAATLPRLDLVLLNAGLKFKDRRESKTGHEAHVAVNHLGTALLSLLLLPSLRRTTQGVRKQEGLGPSRLTFTSSSVAFWVPGSEVQKPDLLKWLDNPVSFPEPEKGEPKRYCLSKLLSVFWIRELSSLVRKDDVVINYVNPGYCMSELHRSDLGVSHGSSASRVAWSAAQGGHQLADALVLHPDSHACYLSEMKIRPVGKFAASPAGKTVQKQLWNETMAVLRGECPGSYVDEFNSE
ncbi:NAD(P)-binding protein [Xylariaceae sp. FL1272]|nr:NAD(P)-binding protein [Xylariaceae sp. FL1272]